MNDMKSMVVAYDQNRGIGADNKLLWFRDLPTDIQHFRDITMNGTIIMGRKTFDSIGKALPGRQNIVVTHRPLDVPGVLAVPDLQAAYVAAEREIYIIGGGSIYEQALADTDVIYATEVQASFPAATVFFPKLDGSWRETECEHHMADGRNKYDFDFVTYVRV